MSNVELRASTIERLRIENEALREELLCWISVDVATCEINGIECEANKRRLAELQGRALPMFAEMEVAA